MLYLIKKNKHYIRTIMWPFNLFSVILTIAHFFQCFPHLFVDITVDPDTLQIIKYSTAELMWI